IAVANRLRASEAESIELDRVASDRSLSTLRLLEQALRVHEQHGDMACPVCHDGTLDATWARESRAAVSADRRHLAALNDARERLESARSEALRALAPAPAILDHSPVLQLEETVAAARGAWQQWTAI